MYAYAGKGVSSKGVQRGGRGSKKIIGIAIYRVLFNLAFHCTKTAIREPRLREPRFCPIFFPLIFIWYCVELWGVACVGVVR